MTTGQKIFNRIKNEYENEAATMRLIVLFEVLCDVYELDYKLEYLDAHLLNFDNVEDYINDVKQLNAID